MWFTLRYLVEASLYPHLGWMPHYIPLNRTIGPCHPRYSRPSSPRRACQKPGNGEYAFHVVYVFVCVFVCLLARLFACLLACRCGGATSDLLSLNPSAQNAKMTNSPFATLAHWSSVQAMRKHAPQFPSLRQLPRHTFHKK